MEKLINIEDRKDLSTFAALKNVVELFDITKEDKCCVKEATISVNETTISIKEADKTATATVHEEKIETGTSKPELMLDKETLIAQYLQLTGEKQTLQDRHSMLQMKVMERLKDKKGDNMSESDGLSVVKKNFMNNNNVKDPDEMKQQFIEDLSTYVSLKQEAQLAKEHFHEILSQKNEECQTWRGNILKKKEQIQDLEKIAISRIIQDHHLKDEIDKLMENKGDREKEIESIRLRNIRLKIKIKKLQAILMSKDKAGGSILEFEQLKLENQANNERIEEKNEEVLKLKSKISSSLQVTTHGREKLYFLETTLHHEKEILAEADKSLAKMREELSRMKNSRDSLRRSNNNLKTSGGILYNKPLLRDYEDCNEDCERMRNYIMRLKDTYSLIKAQIDPSKRIV